MMNEKRMDGKIEEKTYARIGLMGNPSDGFYGKTISSCITNFCATITLTESLKITIAAHNDFDRRVFNDLGELETKAKRDGYYGGIRLVYATCKRFSEYCRENHIDLDGRKYTIRYDTKIPRQVGLGGSSAIIVSLLKALMRFYGLTERDIPLELQPNLVLSVETDELGINAGLQDRVIQTYGGTVFMDFSRSIMESEGHGKYDPMKCITLPQLFLAHIDGSGKDSGKMHNKTRYRFEEQDKEITDAMSKFADYALEAKQALDKGDHKRFGELMDMNFDLRRKIYGDALIGEKNLKMISIARELGAPAKFPGSGGAVIGMYEGEEQYKRLKEAYLKQGFRFGKVYPQESPQHTKRS